MAVVADHCPHIEVAVVDRNQSRITVWNEQDLNCLLKYESVIDLVVGRTRGRNLYPLTFVDKANAKADMVSISLKTPAKS